MVIAFSVVYTVCTLLFYLIGDGSNVWWQTFDITRLTLGTTMFALTTLCSKSLTVSDRLHLRWIIALTVALSLYTVVCGYLSADGDEAELLWIYEHTDFLAYLLSILFIILIIFTIRLSRKEWAGRLFKTH